MSNDTDEVLATVTRGARGALQVRRCTYRGKSYIDVREFYVGENGDLLPGRKGVTIKTPDEVQAVVAALQGARL